MATPSTNTTTAAAPKAVNLEPLKQELFNLLDAGAKPAQLVEFVEDAIVKHTELQNRTTVANGQAAVDAASHSKKQFDDENLC